MNFELNLNSNIKNIWLSSIAAPWIMIVGSNHRFRCLKSIKVLLFPYKCFIFMCFHGTTRPCNDQCHFPQKLWIWRTLMDDMLTVDLTLTQKHENKKLDSIQVLMLCSISDRITKLPCAQWGLKQSEAVTCRQGGRTRPYSSRWCSRTVQSLGVGSPWTSQCLVIRPGRRGWRSSRSWSIARRHARLTARSRAARGLEGVRENCPADRDDCCCCRLSVDFLQT